MPIDLQAIALLLVLAGFTITVGSIAYWSLKLGITPTPSSFRVRNALKPLLPEGIKNDIVEMGCGWGSLLPLLERQYPSSRIIACERSPIPWLFSRCRFYRHPGIDVRKMDIKHLDLASTGLVVCYLQKDIMKELSEHFRMHLPLNSYILTLTFHLPGWKPLKTIHATDLYNTPVYLYRKDQAPECWQTGIRVSELTSVQR
ncbi:MAG: hypothetical protein ACR2PT_19265 [Endozoicomonas sp.]